MASKSMHFLRKYQKIVLVVMGVILMVTFTVGTSLSLLFDRQREGRPTDPIALTWENGPVRESELQVMRYRHNAARQFLFTLIAETIQRGGRPVVNGQVITDLQTLQRVGVGIQMDDSDPSLVTTMLMEAQARKQGIVVDREAVKAHLRRLTEPELREAEWAEVMSNVLGEHSRLSADDVLDQLAYELRAQHAWLLANAGMGTVPPGKMWECFNRLNRRAAIEAFPIDVEPYVKDVKGEPTPTELQNLFDEGRFRDPNPNSHEPGFRKPHKVAFEYVKVDFAPFLETAMKEVTDEQIQKQYELNISQGKHKVQELPPATSGEAAKPAATPPADPKPGETKPDEKKEPAEAKPAETKTGEAKPGDAKPADAKPADAKPEEATPANPAPECQEKKAEDSAT
ncbi:MAG TPA: hypothetical protein VFB80_18950, partial [Pirellulaceae bacterium]|nr:hypothetical protein [Pirellulaceae bacterium]